MKVISLPIKPKQEAGYYLNHHYLIIHQRDADPDKQWRWQVYHGDLVYLGEAPSLQWSHRRARARIKKIIRAEEEQEERMVLHGD